MNTAAEILESITLHVAGDNVWMPKDWIYQAMQQYAKQACEEQRKKCFSEGKVTSYGGTELFICDRDLILNASLPELK